MPPETASRLPALPMLLLGTVTVIAGDVSKTPGAATRLPVPCTVRFKAVVPLILAFTARLLFNEGARLTRAPLRLPLTLMAPVAERLNSFPADEALREAAPV